MNKKCLAMLFAMSMVCIGLWAQSSEDNLTGKQLMENVYNRKVPDDLQGNLKMILEDKRGNQRVREISQFIKSSGKDEKKIMFFTAPADVRDTSFMSWSYDDDSKDDSQWIYLPALKKIKRIASSNSNDYFMGSDFTYDDLGTRNPTEDTHTLLRKETIDEKSCYVIESIPLDTETMYSKTITWVLPSSWLGVKKEFYDQDGDLLKTLEIQKVEEIKGYSVIASSLMTNVQKEHTTQMELSDLELNTGIKNTIFSERIMMRGM